MPPVRNDRLTSQGWEELQSQRRWLSLTGRLPNPATDARPWLGQSPTADCSRSQRRHTGQKQDRGQADREIGSGGRP